MGRPLPLWFSLLLGAILLGATSYGLAVDDAYRVSPGVRADFPDVMRGQDLLTLLTIPLLVTAAVLAWAGSLKAHLVWLGLLLYYTYSDVAYALSPFNDAFLLYVATLGLAGYALLDGLLRLDLSRVGPAMEQMPRRPVGWFLIGVGVLFVGLWLAMVLPAIPGGLPGGRVTYDIASVIHVLDLAFVLPLLIATGRLLLRGHPAGPVLGAVLLAKMVTLGLALLSMNLFVASPSSGEMVLWVVIAAVSVALLAATLQRARSVEAPWLRASLWPGVELTPQGVSSSHDLHDHHDPGPSVRRGRARSS
ncbi:MAG: hypothetical protein ACXWDI_16665 [Nocardioides sp.]